MGELIRQYQYEIAVNGADATPDLKSHFFEMEVNDVTEGQDTASVTLNDPGGALTARRVFKRGDKIALKAGFDKLEKLFDGTINRVSLTYAAARVVALECTTLDMAAPAVRQPAADAYTDTTPADAVSDLCERAGLDIGEISLDAGPSLPAGDHYPAFDETPLKSAKRICSEQVGGTLAFKKGTARIYGADRGAVGPSVATLEWGKTPELISITIYESREEEPPKEYEATANLPGTSDPAESLDELAAPGSFSLEQAEKLPPGKPAPDKLAGYHDPAAGQRSDTETKLRAGANLAGRDIAMATARLSGRDPITAGSWVTVKGTAYDGSYFVKTAAHRFSSGYELTLTLTDRRA